MDEASVVSNIDRLVQGWQGRLTGTVPLGDHPELRAVRPAPCQSAGALPLSSVAQLAIGVPERALVRDLSANVHEALASPADGADLEAPLAVVADWPH